MKVKIGELKTHLSKYLRQLEKDGEPIEVCVRDDSAAYLNPIRRSASDEPERYKLKETLRSAGIHVSQ